MQIINNLKKKYNKFDLNLMKINILNTKLISKLIKIKIRILSVALSLKWLQGELVNFRRLCKTPRINRSFRILEPGGRRQEPRPEGPLARIIHVNRRIAL